MSAGHYRHLRRTPYTRASLSWRGCVPSRWRSRPLGSNRSKARPQILSRTSPVAVVVVVVELVARGALVVPVVHRRPLPRRWRRRRMRLRPRVRGRRWFAAAPSVGVVLGVYADRRTKRREVCGKGGRTLGSLGDPNPEGAAPEPPIVPTGSSCLTQRSIAV